MGHLAYLLDDFSLLGDPRFIWTGRPQQGRCYQIVLGLAAAGPFPVWQRLALGPWPVSEQTNINPITYYLVEGHFATRKTLNNKQSRFFEDQGRAMGRAWLHDNRGASGCYGGAWRSIPDLHPGFIPRKSSSQFWASG